jgi:GNAT superfamily N-acetyltransferase
MEINIREGTPADFEIIQFLNNEVFIDNAQYDPFLNIKWPYSQTGIGYYHKALAGDKYLCLIAEYKSRPVGYLIGKIGGFSYRICKTLEIDNMGTIPDFRSKGIGTKLVAELRGRCKKLGIERIYVCTHFRNQEAINFYKKQGLLPVDISLEGSI